jgi:hypothetical protein
MSNRLVRRTRPTRTAVLVVSAFLNKRDGAARECPECGAKWAVELDSEGTPHVWKDGTEEQRAVLDWYGNNVPIECWTEEQTAAAKAGASDRRVDWPSDSCTPSSTTPMS